MGEINLNWSYMCQCVPQTILSIIAANWHNHKIRSTSSLASAEKRFDSFRVLCRAQLFMVILRHYAGNVRCAQMLSREWSTRVLSFILLYFMCQLFYGPYLSFSINPFYSFKKWPWQSKVTSLNISDECSHCKIMKLLFYLCVLSRIYANEISGWQSVINNDKRMTVHLKWWWKLMFGFLQMCHQDGLMLFVMVMDRIPFGKEHLRCWPFHFVGVHTVPICACVSEYVHLCITSFEWYQR